MAGNDRPEPSDAATAVWKLMSDLVLDNQRRKAVADATGMSFGRTRALRRVSRRPMAMSELATALGIDPPNATVLVDELEQQGLVRRRQNPDDRRSKLVEATRKGAGIARRADAILDTPPEALTVMSERDLETLRRLLSSDR
jgi:DNA-binding MarR family transcriptional regulator